MVRNIVAVTLDHITLVPLVMALLLRMLQDRQRPIWPWILVQLPIVASAALGISRHDEFLGFDLTTYWQIAVMTIFVVYYIYALIQYSRWLRENYADLEHKEVWRSLLFMAALFVVYEVYFTNPGEMAREYLAQLETLVIVAFLLWRVETLQEIDDKMADTSQADEAASVNESTAINIQQQLDTICEARQLYLQHDLTLQQLAAALGTNRTYLGNYFVQQGYTYNTYINNLRIKHFKQLYRESVYRACSTERIPQLSYLFFGVQAVRGTELYSLDEEFIGLRLAKFTNLVAKFTKTLLLPILLLQNPKELVTFAGQNE